jgi:hypothetical protein
MVVARHGLQGGEPASCLRLGGLQEEAPAKFGKSSSLLLLVGPRVLDRLLTLACFSRGSVVPNPTPTSRRGQKARPSRSPR